MGKIILKSLSMTGFRSFDEKCSISFQESGMVLIRGKNLDTNGSSGSGKSTINLAISYLLDFCPYPATVIQSWHSTPMVVEGSFDCGGTIVIIKRSPGLSVKVGKAKPVSGKAAEKKLDEVFGLDAGMRSALIYRGQKKPGLFLSKTDLEKKEFLTQLLGLEQFEKAIEESQERIRSLSASYEAADVGISELPPSNPPEEPKYVNLDELTEWHDALRQKYTDMETDIKRLIIERDNLIIAEKEHADQIFDSFKPQIQELSNEIRATWNEVTNFTSDRSEVERLTVLLENCNYRINALKVIDERTRAQCEQERSRMDRAIQDIMVSFGQLKQLEEKRQKLHNEYTRLGQNMCPTCERTWEAAQLQQTKVHQEMVLVIQQINSINQKRPELDSLNREKETIQFVPNPDIQKFLTAKTTIVSNLSTEEERIKGEVALLQSKVGEKVAVKEAELAALSYKATKERDEFLLKEDRPSSLMQITLNKALEECQSTRFTAAQLYGEIKNQESKNNGWKNLYEEQKKTYDAFLELSAKRRTQFDKIKQDLDVERDFLGLIDRTGFLGAVFDEVLHEISNETNKILGSVANTCHVTLHFRSESQTQKGTTKKSIVPVVKIGGIEAPFSSGLSGGMQTSVELAVDLAVGAVVSRRTGSFPGFLMLDECFEGLDTISKESCMEILQRYANDRLVLVVDHSSEFKELFSNTIDIEFKNGRSTIV